ncbi:MAG: PAS domain-containing protein [Janthinobacterium lividum]
MAAVDNPLEVFFDLSPTGAALYAPVLDAAGDVVDFTCERLNPAAQRLLRLPPQPVATHRQQFLAGQPGEASFALLRAAWLAGGAAQQADLPYPAAGPGQLLHLEARRVGETLLVSLAVLAGAASPANQLPSHSEQLLQLLQLLPANVVLLTGPDHVCELLTPQYQQLFPGRALLGRPVREALPELAGQGFFEILDRVYQTGEPLHLPETEAWTDFADAEQLAPRYYNASFLPVRDAQGQVAGILNVSFDVTALVAARQQVQQFNQALEARVSARTQQLTEQQSLLSHILGQAPAAIAALSGPEHRYTFFNAPYQALVAGRARVGLRVDEVLPEVVEQGFIGLLDRVYATGEAFAGTATPLMLHNEATSHTEQRYVDFTYQPLVDGQQRPLGILAFILDVTDRVRARKQADTLQAAMLAVVKHQGEERENVFQLFEQAPAVICLLREPEHRIEYLNPAFQALLPGQVLRGRTLAQVLPNATALIALFDEIYTLGHTHFQHEILVTVSPVDGGPATRHYFDFTYQAYRENDRIAGVFLFGFEVTEQVLARQQRADQQAELQRIFEQAPVAIAIMRGPRLVVELANAAMGSIWGRSPAQVLGQPYFEALPDTAGQGFEQLLAQVLRTGEPHTITEAPVQLDRAHTGQPTLAYVNFVFQPLLDAQQQVAGLIAIGLEVTAQVMAREQVQHLNQELAATNGRLTSTNMDLDTFVYTASHDLKAPITNIEGLLIALREHLPPVVQQTALVAQILDLIQDSVARFQQTIAHLAEIAQLQQADAAEPVELAILVEDVRLDLAPLLEATQATLTVHLDACAATLWMAPKTLRSVVYNLLSNAVKYHFPARSPLVELRTYCTEAYVMLVVRDNGLGLTERQQGQLFGMFRRLHTHVEGSGVGLFMVKRLVENAGGTITVDSTPDVGSTFTVAFPNVSLAPASTRRVP